MNSRDVEELASVMADRHKIKLPKPPLLLLFQNAHGGGRPFKYPTYGPGMCYMKNATYSRVLPRLMPHFSLRLAECTPLVAGRGDTMTKFSTDLNWVRSAVGTRDDWTAVIGFGKQAEKALLAVGAHNAFKTILLPHPVAFQWRRALMDELIEELTK